MDKVKISDARKECKLCGRVYGANNIERTCLCGGFLYVVGGYWQRKTGGDADGQADTGAVHRRLRTDKRD